jgi:hypothetical protein
VLFVAEARLTEEMRDRFAQAYKADSVYQKIISDLATPPSSGRKPATTKSNEVVVNASKPGHPFRLADRLLYNRDDNGTERLVIPKSLVQEILQVVHDDKHHFGRDRMMKELEMIHFRKKRYLVDQYVKKCHTCGANRQNDKKPIGDYQPIQAPLEPMHTITMDFIVGLPKVPSVGTPWNHKNYDAFNALLTITCKSSKRTTLIPGHDEYSAEDWASVVGPQFLLADWACPSVIISDRDAKFTSKFWNAFWNSFKTRLMMTTAWHPQSDGQSEVKNKIVELAIRYHAYENPDEDWVDLIPALQWNLNSAHSRVINASPHEYLFGFKIAGPLDRLTGVFKEATEIRFMREAIRQDAQLAIDISNAAAKRRYDGQHRQVKFNEGDQVWLTLGRYKLKGNQNAKTSPRREGPYTIKRIVTPLAYELDLPYGSKIHPVISIQYLTKYECDDDPFERRPIPPGPLEYEQGEYSGDTDDDGKVYEVERVVDHRPKKGKIREYLVRWKGYGSKDDQWKKVGDLAHCQELIDEYLSRLQAKNLLGKIDGGKKQKS